MAVLTRLTRLVRADLNALLDRLEEPDILLAQALRDMEQAVADDERALAALRRDHERLAARRAALDGRRGGLDDELTLCLDAGQDDLARALLRRRLEGEQLDRLLRERAAAAADRIQALERQLAERRRRLDAIRAEAELVMPEPDESDEPFGATDALADRPRPIADADIEIALLAAKRRRAS
jgi:phage shock protein A